MDEGLPYAQFTDVTFIRGATLERFLHDEQESDKLPKGVEFFWVYDPTNYMLTNQCDACVKKHSFKNLDCSASSHSRSPATDPNRLYTFRDLEKSVNLFRMSYTDYASTRIRGCVVRGLRLSKV
jgi:hypothetical protein